MTPVTLFSYITPEEQERMRICFDMHEAVYRNNETVMEYASSMKKIWCYRGNDKERAAGSF